MSVSVSVVDVYVYAHAGILAAPLGSSTGMSSEKCAPGDTTRVRKQTQQ